MFTNQNKLSNHLFFMRLALFQARKNLGNTKENPSVGCIITKNNLVISAGCTGINGRPHAEHNAIVYSRKNLKDSQMYVTLEPCSHHAITSPCIEKIIKKRLKRVFFSVSDPDLRSYKKSKSLLNKENISVNKGVYQNEVKNFYRSYFKSKKSPLPFVTCKLAISKDHFTIVKKNKWITNNYSRARAHLIRSYHDCIITSSKTIIADNSRLTCRIDGLNNRSPSRIILDNKLNIPLKSNIIKEASKYRTIIFYNKFNKKKIAQLKKLRVKLFKISRDENNNLDLHKVLVKAKSLGFYRILVESGMKLINNFLNKNLIDDFNLFISNKKLEKRGKAKITNDLKLFLMKKKSYIEKVNLFGEKLIIYKIK